MNEVLKWPQPLTYKPNVHFLKNTLTFISKAPQKIINYFEKGPLPLTQTMFTFVCIILLNVFWRSFLDSHLNDLNKAFDLFISHMSYSLLFYSLKALLLLILLHYATQKPIKQIAQTVLPCFILLFVAPCFDWLGKPFQTLFVFYAIFCYIYCTRKTWRVAFFYTVIACSLLFLNDSFHYLLAPFLKTSVFTTFKMIHYYVLSITVATLWVFFLTGRTFFLEMIKDLRWLRILHYQLMVLFGSVLALDGCSISWHDIIFNPQSDVLVHFIFCNISICCAGLFSIITNNIADQSIDRISNPLRPLITGAVPLALYRKTGHGALVLALVYAFLAGAQALALIAVIMATYYLYSVPPLRLKRIPLFSKSIIGFNSLVLILLGFLLVTDQIMKFPVLLIPIYLIGFTLCANFIDLKDHEGDPHDNILTLPGLIGLKKAKQFISAAFFFTYLSFYFLLPDPALWPGLVAGGTVQVYLIHKNNSEKINFLFYLFSMIALIGSFGVRFVKP